MIGYQYIDCYLTMEDNEVTLYLSKDKVDNIENLKHELSIGKKFSSEEWKNYSLEDKRKPVKSNESFVADGFLKFAPDYIQEERTFENDASAADYTNEDETITEVKNIKVKMTGPVRPRKKRS